MMLNNGWRIKQAKSIESESESDFILEQILNVDNQ